MQWQNMALWLVAFGIGIAVVYGLNYPKRLGLGQVKVPLTKVENAFYGSLQRLAWAIAVSWVIFACCRGYGGKLLFQYFSIF